MKQFDVAAVCNALMDILVEVDETLIKRFELRKGAMHLVETSRQKEILSALNGHQKTQELGGSAMNALRTLAALGKKTAFTGMVSNDDFGHRIKDRMGSLGIKANLGYSDEATGTCLILITPDGERTMNTHLGASRLYNETLVPHQDIASSKVFHFCGYQWDTDGQKAAILKAIDTARNNSCIVSFDVADPFVVERHRDEFKRIITEEADIVFANREESALLFETTPEEAAKAIAKSGAIAVIKLGAKGAMIRKGDEVIMIPPVPTKVIDTTAAGDMFAAGVLYGFTSGKALDICGKMGATLASDVISRIGATVSENTLASVQDM